MTHEGSCAFELSMPRQLLDEWVLYRKLKLIKPDPEDFPVAGQPEWFTPGPPEDYDVWGPASDSGPGFLRIYQDRTTKHIFVCDQR